MKTSKAGKESSKAELREASGMLYEEEKDLRKEAMWIESKRGVG
jgi:hypothetical protein